MTEEAPVTERYRLDVKGKRWPEVLKWLSETTGKEVIFHCLPAGTCDVAAPAGGRLTLNEMIDILNEDLLSGKRPEPCYLLPRARNITLLPRERDTDRPTSPVPVECLPSYPRTVPVVIAIRIRSLDVGELVPRVKKLLGPLGKVVALNHSKRLLVEDQAGNLDRVVKFVGDLDRPEKRLGLVSPAPDCMMGSQR